MVPIVCCLHECILHVGLECSLQWAKQSFLKTFVYLHPQILMLFENKVSINVIS